MDYCNSNILKFIKPGTTTRVYTRVHGTVFSVLKCHGLSWSIFLSICCLVTLALAAKQSLLEAAGGEVLTNTAIHFSSNGRSTGWCGCGSLPILSLTARQSWLEVGCSAAKLWPPSRHTHAAWRVWPELERHASTTATPRTSSVARPAAKSSLLYGCAVRNVYLVCSIWIPNRLG
jgi:hypothetical protein